MICGVIWNRAPFRKEPFSAKANPIEKRKERFDDIFELVEAPVDRAGFYTRFVEGVGFPKLVARRLKRACCIRCSG